MPLNQSNRKKLQLFRIEIVYSLLLLTGYIKLYLILLNLNKIDFTLVISLVLMSILFLRYVTNTGKHHLLPEEICSLGLMIAFVGVTLFSISYTSSSSYYLSKAMNFGVTVFAFMLPFFVKDFDVKYCMRLFVRLSFVIVLIYLIIFPFLFYNPDYENVKLAYLTIGYLCGLNFLILVSEDESNLLLKVFFVAALLITGARGPLLFMVLSYFIIFIYSSNERRKLYSVKSLSLFVISVFVLIFLILQNEMFLELIDRSIGRISTLFDDKVGSSVGVRLQHIEESIQHISDKPLLGYGFGSYGIEVFGQDIRSYPHNAFIEVWFEIGILGLISFTLLNLYHLTLLFIRLDLKKFFVVFYLFINSLKSDSFADLKILLGFYAIYMLYSYSNRLSEFSGKAFNQAKYLSINNPGLNRFEKETVY